MFAECVLRPTIPDHYDWFAILPDGTEIAVGCNVPDGESPQSVPEGWEYDQSVEPTRWIVPDES